MDELEAFIKELNLVFTGTMDKYEFASPNFNLKEKLVEYKNCISLYKLISDFNKKYQDFKKDFSAIKKIDLPEPVQVISFDKCDKTDLPVYTRSLLMYAPMIPSECDIIILSEYKGEFNSVSKNNLDPLHRNQKKENLGLDKKQIESYLDLFEKHDEFLEEYNFLKNQFVFGDGIRILTTVVEGNLLESLERFKVSFGEQSSFSTIFVSLDKKQEVDINDSTLLLDYQNQELTEEKAEKVLKRVYISEDTLEERKKSHFGR